MRNKKWRQIAAISILLLTAATFIYYFAAHPELLTELKHIPRGVFISVLLLDFCVVIATGLILMATIMLCKIPLGARESMLVTMYSSIINFFGPLQSGPAFRAVYFKKKHKLKIKDYTLATFVYYFCFAFFSGLFLVSGILKWWLIPLSLMGLVMVLWVVRSNSGLVSRLRAFNLRALGFLAAATLLQVVLMSIIYFIELRSVDATINYGQAIIYTGAANFALFVSITPGAIGFREAFLVFSEHLHHISYSAIVAANVVDRTMYITMLLILAVIIFGTHASRGFKALTENKKSDNAEAQD